MRIQRLGFLALIPVVAAACSGEAVQSTPQPQPGRGGGAAVPIVTAIAARKPMPITISVIGTAEASSTVAVRAQITGELTSVAFQEGDDVQKGQLLFSLDKRPLEAALKQAEANLARDMAQAANARSQAQRYEDLANRGIATKEQLETARTSATALDATVGADRAAVENARVQLQYATIYAPIAGRTGALMVHAGNLVRANDATPLVVINQVTPISVSFAIPESRLPDFKTYAVDVESPGASQAEATRVMGAFLRDVVRLNAETHNFRLMGPDETASNRLDKVFEATDRIWMQEIEPYDVHLARQGRVMEVLSEHLCQGWLEGYLLTGRHGLFSCYEAFIHIVDSMLNQHAKWLKVCNDIPWRRPIGSLNYLLSSHVWRQDHNGFSHQDPGFIDHVVNKKAEVIRVYLPPDANCLLSVTDHCLRSRNYVNVVVAGKQPAPQWLTMDEAVKHCEAGLGIWEWASNDRGGNPELGARIGRLWRRFQCQPELRRRDHEDGHVQARPGRDRGLRVHQFASQTRDREVGRDRGSQRLRAPRHRILVDVATDGLASGILDGLRGRKIRKALREVHRAVLVGEARHFPDHRLSEPRRLL